MKRIVPALLVPVLFMLLSCCPLRAGGQIELLILHTNDFHGSLLPVSDIHIAPPPAKIGGAAFIAGKIRELKNGNAGRTVLVDSGDCATGTALSNAFYGIPVIEYMNLAGYDAMALGNHEFDWGVGKLMAMRTHAKFPFLAANLIDRRTGKVPPYAQPYSIVEKEGVKIGLVGLITMNTTILQNPNRIKNLLFLPPEEPARKAIEELHRKGVRIILVLSHLGVEDDKALARKVPGIACIIGGHSHTALQQPLKVDETVIVQTGCHGSSLGKVKLILDSDSGSVKSFAGELIPVIDSIILPDKEVEAMVAPYQKKIQASMDEVLGTAEGDLLNEPLGDTESTPLGNFITDALRITCKADMALYKSDGIRTDILKGAIRKGDLYQVLPYDNKVIKAELTGREIRGMLELIVESPFLTQVSGLRVLYHGSKQKGERIEAFLPGGEPLADERSYCLATTDYLFYLNMVGGGFDVLKKKHRSELFSREIVERYITKQKKVVPSREGRVKKLP
ncbi:MAG: bifunctional UDP-sugar hydrolase/5'-nucleotidase [Candidatus Eremiobacteraeota bacterium]|nr:bifunctional UDP-sugar hydrolase/5'-nucleotidase [Candidatus Eremiobacteraeota bacterium]